MTVQHRRRIEWQLFVCVASFAIQAAAQEISWSIPEDGGTPRDTNRIERLGPDEFRVRASFEEGGQSVLRHAVSRVDLICRNTGPQQVANQLPLMAAARPLFVRNCAVVSPAVSREPETGSLMADVVRSEMFVSCKSIRSA